MEKIEIKVKGMSCGHCKMAVEKALMAVEGVESASVDLEKGKADITYDPSKASVESMKKAVVDAGYQA
ncbi:copper ion binding protein [Methanohalophilus sp.]|uniref:copper ion binding protein n=1 Tax=Methanohalophilus sp. TaxID=1966352 RepID=UPI00262C852B|nr:copper ion binding protein [Methanohalophilus sp.]MDK2893158.1 copper chaperone [Methanohalophilus sp.]